MKSLYATAHRTWPELAYELPANDVWEVPQDVHEVRGEMETRGPWQIVSGYKALAYTWDEQDTEHYGTYYKSVRVYGVRSLSNPRESGHDLEGTVSIRGKKYRAFTSELMFRRVDGSLVSVAALHVCKSQPFVTITLGGHDNEQLRSTRRRMRQLPPSPFASRWPLP